MKLISSFLLVLMLFSVSIFGQSTKTYNIKWDPAVVSDSVKYWEVYFEKRATNSGFTLVDGMEYTTGLDVFKQSSVVINTGQAAPFYTITVNTDGGWMVAGIIAYNDIRSQLGASASTKNAKKPGKPTGVRIE